MREDAVLICNWNQSPGGITAWVKARPRLRVSAPTFTEAEERLAETIRDANVAMRAVIEFDPPRPLGSAALKYSKPNLFTICGDAYFETDAPRRTPFEDPSEIESRLRRLDTFYEKPVCRECKYTSGRRSTKLVTTEYATKYDGAFGSLSDDGGPRHEIVSEEFLALLTPEETRRLEFRPTIRRGRRRYFELAGPNGPPLVAVVGLPVSGWRCAACDYRVWGCSLDDMSINAFVAQADLPDPALGVFTIGEFPELQLAVKASRWKELVGRRGTRGFCSAPLGVVPDDEVLRHPEPPTVS